jgi:hypothetical protein
MFELVITAATILVVALIIVSVRSHVNYRTAMKQIDEDFKLGLPESLESLNTCIKVQQGLLIKAIYQINQHAALITKLEDRLTECELPR